MKIHGFTLLECLITISLLAILLGLGVPSLSSQIKSTKVRTASQDLFSAIQATRTKAVMSHQRTVLRHSSSWTSGWEMFVDRNNNGVRDNDEPLLSQSPSLTGVRIKTNNPLRNYISFIGSGESRFAGQENGGAFQAGTIKICPEGGGDGYQLILARSGRTRIDEISAADCEADS